MAFDDDLNENDIAFLRSEAAKLYGGINPERWERVREQDFLPLCEEITGQRCLRNSFIHCPFHGADSTPSFKIYDNDAYCWGCGEKYDAVSLVAKYRDCNRFQALLWCETYFQLPPMESAVIEDIEDEEQELKFSETRGRYIKFASTAIQKSKNPEMAEEYLRYYFEGKQKDDAVPLLQVLGPDIIAELTKE
jgi:hypothetical protein